MIVERARVQPVTAAAEWWRGAVIYQIYPRSFLDTNGDGVGDLQGVIERLDYVASLGVDAVWLSPFFKSPMKDFGYDISDYRAVDPIFGDMAQFDRLLERAHELGLKVLIDQVYSHTSDQHAWFVESRADRAGAKADWYVWADPKEDGSPPSNWQSVFGGPAWTWDARRKQYYLHNFLPSQPDLNLHNPAVQEAILDTTRFWLERGVDGFRLDAVNFMMHDPSLRDNPPAIDGGKRGRPFDYQQHLFNKSHPDIVRMLHRLQSVVSEYGGRFTLAEIGGELADREMKAYTAGPEGLDSAYAFSFLYAERLTPELLRSALRAWTGAEGEGWPSWALSNHDAPRAASRWASPEDCAATAKLNLLLLTAIRGNPIIYQGEELGLPQADLPLSALKDPEAIANWPETLGRDGARTPMPWRADDPTGGFTAGEPWLPCPPEHRKLAVERQEGEATSALNLTRRLLALRSSEAALRLGSLHLRESHEPVVVFERSHQGRTLICAINLGAGEASTPPLGRILASVNGGSAERLPYRGGVIAEAP
ncbi:alpha-amylase family glycosyl hydrolase [Brevundimonas sp.]|uniref:alpha-amylase family glycosyl hydrolase n=1 Tax=Brevundimonas sp. TaxID=1871086 RepID=UPI0025F459FE|nr:alpha-amylase family glycosyl hydrolase [Brevundimonas sp.]